MDSELIEVLIFKKVGAGVRSPDFCRGNSGKHYEMEASESVLLWLSGLQVFASVQGAEEQVGRGSAP